MDKYIFIKRKVLPKDYCENLVKVFEKSHLYDNSRGYKCVDVFFNTDSDFSLIRMKLLCALEEYTKKHSFLRKLANYSKLHLYNDFMIKKFLPGDYYEHLKASKPEDGEHMEHGSSFNDCRRMLAWMFYLNDIKKGGGTRWPQQNFTSRPRAGDLYIWPAGWTHSHHGLPAPKETKYLMSGWCSLHD